MVVRLSVLVDQSDTEDRVFLKCLCFGHLTKFINTHQF